MDIEKVGRGRVLMTTIMVVVCLVIFFSTQSAWAFKPTNSSSGKNASDSTHQSITEDTIKDAIQEFFGITTLTNSMTKARDEIAEADSNIDFSSTFFSEKYHFDAESFADGQALILSEFDSVIAALKSKNASGARKQLGSALHTIQDFYAHSDWVELNGGAMNPDVGRKGHTIGNVAVAKDATCKSCTANTNTPNCPNCTGNVTTTKLTSGYFGIIFSSKPAGKCSHGGSGDKTATTAPTGGINKDTSLCDSSPHFNLHGAAVAGAKASSLQFLRDIKNNVSVPELKLLLGIGPTLAMSIDTTGSMGSIISSVKSQAIQIIDSRLGTDQEPSKYVLAPFNDPSVGPLSVTDDPTVFKQAISALTASGGGDCPELSMTGMLQGISAVDDGASLFMFTDASAKDTGLAGNVSSAAAAKDVKVYPIAFGSCSPIDPGYVRVASESGGQLFVLSPAEAGNITKLADAVVRPNAVDLLHISDTLLGGAKVYTVPVDRALSRITFSVSGTTNVSITKPGGSVISAADPNVNLVTLSSGVVYTITSPAAGSWTVSVNGSGSISLLASGDSGLSLRSFRFVEFGGRPGHEGYIPQQGYPLAGQPTTADSVIDGDFGTAQFEIRTKAGALIQPLSLTRGAGLSSNEFIGPVTLPSDSFVVYLTGTDTSGFPFQRVLAKTIQPQTVSVTAPESQELQPGKFTTYVFQVVNIGAAGTFKISAADNNGWARAPSPSTLTLGTGASAVVSVSLSTPTTAALGSEDTLTVTAENVSGISAHNFAVVESIVVAANHPPDVSEAIASVDSLWPPNHKMVPVSIVGVTDPDGDPVTITITAVTQSEPTLSSGSGDTCPDASDIGTSTLSLRAERDGNGSGRQYTLFFTADDGHGGTSRGSVNVIVPHDQGKGATPTDDVFDSTVCPTP